MQLKLHTPPMSLNSYSKYSKREETFLRTYHYRSYFETLRILSNTWLRKLSKLFKTFKIWTYRVFQDFWVFKALLKFWRFKIYQELLRNWDLNNLGLHIESPCYFTLVQTAKLSTVPILGPSMKKEKYCSNRCRIFDRLERFAIHSSKFVCWNRVANESGGS